MHTFIRSLLATALTLSGLALVAPATPALAASACLSNSTLTSSASTVAGGGTVTLTVTLKDCTGAAVAGVTVSFSQLGGPCAATLSSATGVTDANGQASTTVTFPVNCAGQYTFGVAAAGFTLQTTVVESGAFPATGAEPPSSGSIPLGVILVGAGILAMVVSLGALARRRRES